MPHVAEGPNGEQLIWMGDTKGWVPMPMAYATKPASNQGATTPEDAVTMEQVKDTAKDVLKSGGVGLAEGALAIPGIPADAKELGAQAYDYGKRTIADWTGKKPDTPREPQEPSFLGFPGAAGIKKKVEQYTGPFYQPQTGLGDLAHEAGQIAPAMIGGGGPIAARLATRIAAPMAASHGVGDFLEGSPAAPAAQVMVSMLAPTATRKVITPFIAKDAARLADADKLANAGLNITAGRRTGHPVLNAIEDRVGIPERFSPENNDKAMTAALLGLKGKGSKAAKADLKGAKENVLDKPVPLADLDTLPNTLTTLGGMGYGFHTGNFDPMHLMEGGLFGSVALPYLKAGALKYGAKPIFTEKGQQWLGNQVLGKDTHNNTQLQRALLYSTPGRLPPEELPPVDVNSR